MRDGTTQQRIKINNMCSCRPINIEILIHQSWQGSRNRENWLEVVMTKRVAPPVFNRQENIPNGSTTIDGPSSSTVHYHPSSGPLVTASPVGCPHVRLLLWAVSVPCPISTNFANQTRCSEATSVFFARQILRASPVSSASLSSIVDHTLPTPLGTRQK